MSQDIESYFDSRMRWKGVQALLRNILLECMLQEEWKWRAPCYTYQGKNVAIIGDFIEHCSFSFFKGSLLQDSVGALVAPGAKSRHTRMYCFTDISQILEQKDLIKTYIFGAIELEKFEQKVDTTSPSLELIDELKSSFEEDVTFQKAYEAFSPGRQRGYLIFFSSAKQSKTRHARIDKYRHRILNGFGMNDGVCGHSKRKPNCDGSHKNLEVD